MDPIDLDTLSKLSPFELKNELIRHASRQSERLMLNAGRANPNFLATLPRQAFFELGLFATGEAERSGVSRADGLGGLPKATGIAARFEQFAQTRREAPGIRFLRAAVAHARRRLACSEADFLHELVQGVLGCNYPEPARILPNAADVIGRYLRQELAGLRPIVGAIDLFAVEGATAGITYVFNSLRENRLLSPGDKIAIGMPIFSPYIEIPQLDDYRLVEVAIDADPELGWQYPDRELDKLLDPEIRALLVVNPGNPTSVEDRPGWAQVGLPASSPNDRQDLIILTDDVYATFADDFVSLFATCPYNTILVYSFSKYFGATGWRLGVIAMHENNVLDAKIAALPQTDRVMLDDRYGSLVVEPRQLEIHRSDGGGQPERCAEPYGRAVDAAAGADGAVRAISVDGRARLLQTSGQKHDSPTLSDASSRTRLRTARRSKRGRVSTPCSISKCWGPSATAGILSTGCCATKTRSRSCFGSPTKPASCCCQGKGLGRPIRRRGSRWRTWMRRITPGSGTFYARSCRNTSTNITSKTRLVRVKLKRLYRSGEPWQPALIVISRAASEGPHGIIGGHNEPRTGRLWFLPS